MSKFLNCMLLFMIIIVSPHNTSFRSSEVVLHLKGRFWHQRTTVLQRVGAYLMGRIPEIVDVMVEDEYELTDEANDAAVLD